MRIEKIYVHYIYAHVCIKPQRNHSDLENKARMQISKAHKRISEWNHIIRNRVANSTTDIINLTALLSGSRDYIWAVYLAKALNPWVCRAFGNFFPASSNLAAYQEAEIASRAKKVQAFSGRGREIFPEARTPQSLLQRCKTEPD